MTRVMFALAAFLVPQAAMAGWGVTAPLTGAGFGGLGGQTFAPIMSPYPTIDYHSGKDLLQVDIWGLVSSITTKENVAFDLSYYHATYRGKVTEDWKGSVAPGVHLGFWKDPVDTQIEGNVNLRMGVQALHDVGVGLYAVPGIGVDSYADDIYLVLSGGVELSVWVTGGGD